MMTDPHTPGKNQSERTVGLMIIALNFDSVVNSEALTSTYMDTPSLLIVSSREGRDLQ